MPAGYNDACYGGNFSKTLAGANPIYSAELDIPDSSWPELGSALSEIAAKYSVKKFDDIRNTKTLKMFSVSLCSADGLFSMADKRTWYFPGEAPAGTPSINITVFAYKKDDRWFRLSKDLDATLRKHWPNKLRTTSTADTRLLNSAL